MPERDADYPKLALGEAKYQDGTTPKETVARDYLDMTSMRRVVSYRRVVDVQRRICGLDLKASESTYDSKKRKK